MKVGDKGMRTGKPEMGSGKVVRFYANQGTVLVNFEKDQCLKYCVYSSLKKDESEILQ